jgi:hypothetical protein
MKIILCFQDFRRPMMRKIKMAIVATVMAIGLTGATAGAALADGSHFEQDHQSDGQRGDWQNRDGQNYQGYYQSRGDWQQNRDEYQNRDRQQYYGNRREGDQQRNRQD